ncbi:aminotransferase class IV family protein [Bacteroides sp. AN502(2024)]|uniref:aminotransferase class IV family protein n=1 Tax=Bacteroides sp. AN502(2024) TaxID=3160599 RepID=UPI0035156862
MYLFIETIRVEDGQIYNLDYHTERFNKTRAVFWKDSVPLDLQEFIPPPPLSGIYKCRIVYGKEVKDVTYTPYQMRQVSSLHLVVSDTIDYTYKSAHREELNALYAHRGMEDDILIVKDGFLTDTSIANIALYDGRTWFTPARPLLRGTKRAELLDRKLIVEKDIPQISLRDYSHIMLFNAMIDWERVILPVNEKHLIL